MLTSIGKVKALWRQGWVEIPEIMVGAGVGFIGCCLSVVGYFVRDAEGRWTSQKYMLRPMIIRPDDPRVKKITHYSNLD